MYNSASVSEFLETACRTNTVRRELMANRTLSSVVVLLGMPVLGAVAGAIIAPRLGSSGMGWDDLADVLGGLFIGAVAGVVAAILLARRLRDRALGRVAAVTGLIALTLIATGVVRYRAAMGAARQQAAEEAERLSRGKVTAPAESPP
jgi:uncharacterized membrane protein